MVVFIKIIIIATHIQIPKITWSEVMSNSIDMICPFKVYVYGLRQWNAFHANFHFLLYTYYLLP